MGEIHHMYTILADTHLLLSHSTACFKKNDPISYNYI